MNLRSAAPTERVLHLIPGISATGKTTMARYMVESLGTSGVNARLVVPHSTRPPRPYEQDGMDYHFHSLDEFQEKFLPLCNDPVSDWEMSEIGGHFYFNSRSATRPTDPYRVSILPVAYAVLADILAEHADGDYKVTVLPIAISEPLAPHWLSQNQPLRPQRDLARELEEQATFLAHYNGDIFYPEWRPTDFSAYTQRAHALMTLSGIALSETIENGP